MRGDYQFIGEHPSLYNHTPPHARGLLVDVHVTAVRVRLIPACAGTTPVKLKIRSAIWAHPRLRGDYLKQYKELEFGNGSSPPARGLRDLLQVCFQRVGLIPACAGTTVCASEALIVITAHPRLRGDYKS